MSDLSSLDDTSSGSEEDSTEQVSDEDAESENLAEIETIDSESVTRANWWRKKRFVDFVD